MTMLTDLYPFLAPDSLSRNASLPVVLLALAADLESIAAGTAPDYRQLASAPLIEDWTAQKTSLGLRLTGRISGHPRLGDCNGITSQIWAADPEGQWVRTLSMFYRLGAPLGGGRDDV